MGTGLVRREGRRCWVLGLGAGSRDRAGGWPHSPSSISPPRTEPQHPAPAPLTLHQLLTLSAVFLASLSLPLHSQVSPNLHWQSLHTEHFHTHFSPGLEQIARRAAGSAERAYSRLSKELHEPRAPIDLVVADNVDVSNGYTTPFPTNRIVIYARPTVDATSLKFLDDWIDLVVSHELTHVFHLDRTRGWWRVGQYVFGRNPFLFPNLYAPSWLDEGIAVYYETRLTGAGRDAGTDFAQTARAMAMDGEMPKLNALSAATPIFPLGNTAYVFGAQLVEFIVPTGSASKMRDFIETSSARTIPFLLNTNARSAFGITFDSAWRRWADSVRRLSMMAASAGSPGLRDLTARGWFTQRLRWTDSSHILFGNNDGRDVSALRELNVAEARGPDGKGVSPRWIARRNSLDITSPLPNGARVFAQLEFTDPYTLRSDLYLEQAGETTQLTDGERLMQPDARERTRPNGSHEIDVVAVQLNPGASRLILLTLLPSPSSSLLTPGSSPSRPSPVARRASNDPSPVARRNPTPVVPLTGSSPDSVWSEPRWSHDGRFIAATRWLHGGTSEIAILDTTGRVIQTLGRSRAVNGSPSWMNGDSAILFTSDRTGRSAIYRANLRTGALDIAASAATGLLESEQSPGGSLIATLHYRGDGYRVATVPVPSGATQRGDSLSQLPPSRNDPVASSAAPLSPYSAWPSLLPRYWLPAIEQSDQNRPMYGFITTGSDVLDRHVYQLQATYEPHFAEPNANFTYQYAGFGNPVVGAGAIEEWDHPTNIVDRNNNPIGLLSRRKFFGSVAVTALRPRVRTNAYLTLGAQMEWRDFRTEPRDLLAGIDSTLRRMYTYPTFFLNAGWSNVRAPILAFSYEDGVQLGASVAQRWRTDTPGATRSTSVVGTASAYKSLDLPGFTHHVIAVRAAAAWEDQNATSEFKAGGVSGSILSIAPGVVLGDGRRTFPVRGFPASAQIGIDALGGSVEYRAPVSLPASGWLMLPLFFQRLSASVFSDAATAWCPSGIAASIICPAKGYPQDWMASAGAELSLDAAYEYDVPYRFRVGAATPVMGRKYFGNNDVAVYFAVGLAF